MPETFRQLRKICGFETQPALARATGLKQGSLSAIELGRVMAPKPETMRRLADALGVDEARILASLEESRREAAEIHARAAQAASRSDDQDSEVDDDYGFVVRLSHGAPVIPFARMVEWAEDIFANHGEKPSRAAIEAAIAMTARCLACLTPPTGMAPPHMTPTALTEFLDELGEDGAIALADAYTMFQRTGVANHALLATRRAFELRHGGIHQALRPGFYEKLGLGANEALSIRYRQAIGRLRSRI